MSAFPRTIVRRKIYPYQGRPLAVFVQHRMPLLFKLFLRYTRKCPLREVELDARLPSRKIFMLHEIQSVLALRFEDQGQFLLCEPYVFEKSALVTLALPSKASMFLILATVLITEQLPNLYLFWSTVKEILVLWTYKPPIPPWLFSSLWMSIP